MKHKSAIATVILSLGIFQPLMSAAVGQAAPNQSVTPSTDEPLTDEQRRLRDAAEIMSRARERQNREAEEPQITVEEAIRMLWGDLGFMLRQGYKVQKSDIDKAGELIEQLKKSNAPASEFMKLGRQLEEEIRLRK